MAEPTEQDRENADLIVDKINWIVTSPEDVRADIAQALADERQAAEDQVVAAEAERDALTDQVAKLNEQLTISRENQQMLSDALVSTVDQLEAAEAERDALKVERDGLREAGDAMHETLAQYVRELVSGHTILYKPDPDYGKIDPEVREEIEGYQRDLARWAALSPPKEGGDA